MTAHDLAAQPTAPDTSRRDPSWGGDEPSVHLVDPSDGSFAPARWHHAYALRILVTDAAVLVAAVTLGAFIRFGAAPRPKAGGADFSVSYWSAGLLLAAGWLLTLHFSRTRNHSVLGNGVEEYRRVIRSSFVFFGVVAIVSLVFDFTWSRGYLAITFPLGVVGLLTGRRAWRSWLHRQRSGGRMISNALVIGGNRSAADITRYLRARPRSGVRVTGVWVPDHSSDHPSWLDVPDVFVPVLGADKSLREAVALTEAELVFVTDSEHLGHQGLRELMWELEALDVDLRLSPNVVDVSGSRIQLAQVGGLPFLDVTQPTYREAAAWPKRLVDRCGAAAIVLLLSPVLLACALAVRLTSQGPVLYRQERIGLDGRPFHMLKFRSMHVDADERLAALLAERGLGSGPMAKIKDDPRVTAVGSVLRRYSLDELPQLLNVLLGTMSLVGPRPQRQFEVDLYDHIAHRRLRVLPGMTGLWQVSGRSDLTWEDAVRLDNYYVENWSMTGDLAILWRTVRAVVKSSGAY